MKCKDCACFDVCYYRAFNDVRPVKRRDDVEKVCKSFVHRDSIKVDAVEVVHGRWEDMHDGKYANPRFHCSVCKEKSLFKDERDVLGNWRQVQALTPFCPHCGAALDGGSDDA